MLEGQERFFELPAEQVDHAFEAIPAGREVEVRPAVVGEGEADAGVDHRDAGEGVADVAELGGRGAEELAAGRRVEEEVADLDDRAGLARGGADLGDVLAGGFENKRRVGGSAVTGRAGGDAKAGDRGDRRQRLATEAQRVHRFELLGPLDLARGVGRHRQRQVLLLDARAVVGHANQLPPAVLHVHGDPARPGVDGVLHQLLHDGRGPFDHLPRGDLVDKQR